MDAERFDDVLGPDSGELAPLAASLQRRRPLPAPAFRGDLARALAALPLPMSGRRLWPLVAALAAAGAIALGLVGLGDAGHGPLAPAGSVQHAQRAGR